MSFRFWFAGYMILLVSASAGTGNVIVVSAPRLDDLDLMAVDTAADVSVIDRAAIEQSGAVSVPELLKSEANVLMRSTSGNPNDGQIAMRGFGENSHLRTLILVDGHKINRPDMGVAGWETIPVSNIERIEVIRGGQNVLYGDHALAGVIKITTRRGAEAGSQVGGTIGSFGYASVFGGHGGAAGNVDYHIGLDMYEMDGFRSNSTSRATTLAGSLAWYAGDTDTVTFRFSCTDSYLQFPGSLTYDQMQQDPTQSNSDGGEFSDTLSGQATAIWETERDWGAARIASGLNLRDMDWELDGIYANNRQAGISIGPRLKYGGDHDFLMAGVDCFYDALDYDSFLPEDTRYEEAHGEFGRATLQPYLFLQNKTERGLILGGGARYEYARTDNLFEDYNNDQLLPEIPLLGLGTIPNPDYKNPPDLVGSNSYDEVVTKDGWAGTLSLTQEFEKDGSVWLRYDRVYRYPSLDEAASYQGYPLSDPLNEDLDPETGNVFEIGSRWNSSIWGASWSAYYMQMDNEIVYDDTAKLNRNLGATQRLGSEIELTVDRSWYGAGARWTFQDAQMDGGEHDGNRVPLVPWNYGVCSAWANPTDVMRLSLTWSYVSEQYLGNDEANEQPEMDAYGLWGLGVDIIMGDRARLNMAIDNLMNETYASTAYVGAYYPGAGRSFRCGITLEF